MSFGISENLDYHSGETFIIFLTDSF